MRYAGIDVSKDKLDVVLLCNDNVLHQVFSNSLKGWQQVTQWLTVEEAASTHVCLEATGRYGDGIAHHLFGVGFAVSVVNPARIHAYGQSRLSRQKTDKADAQLIALFAQTQQPNLWIPPDPAYLQLQMMVRHRNQLQSMLRQEMNRQSSLPADNPLQDLLSDHIRFSEQQIEQLQETIQAFISEQTTLNQQRNLLHSIPGIGDITIAALLAEIGDISRFDNAGQLAAYSGLTPQHRRPGTSVYGRTRISKRGNAKLRKALYFPAMVAMRYNPIIIEFAKRLQAKGHAPKSIIVAVMRKLLHLIYGILKSQTPFNANYLQSKAIVA